MEKYVLEILEAKFIVIDWYWRIKILSPASSRVIEVSRDVKEYP